MRIAEFMEYYKQQAHIVGSNEEKPYPDGNKAKLPLGEMGTLLCSLTFKWTHLHVAFRHTAKLS